MGFFSKDISDFKDFGYNYLHKNRDLHPDWGDDYGLDYERYEPYSDNERFDALKPIYKEIVGKNIDKSSIVHIDNKDNHSYNQGYTPVCSDPFKIAFVDVNVDQQMVDNMNKTLAKDNPLRGKIDVNGDGILSQNEISDYFDKFAVKGYSIPHYNNDPYKPSFSFSQSEDTGKISHFDMENIYALKNNAIIKDALFTKYNGDGSFNTDVKLSYDDIKDKSIISESDFHKLDVASHDCLEKGFIDKGVFDQFEFDKNGDHVIDNDEYAEGMQRVDKYLQERSEAIDNALSKSPEQEGQSYDAGAKLCNNSEPKENIVQQSGNTPDTH